jgi:hypothetical protein
LNDAFLNTLSSPLLSRAGLDKQGLIDLVLPQFDRWPKEKYRWVPQRDTTVKILKRVLLNPKYGFGKIGERVLGPITQCSDRPSSRQKPQVQSMT